MHIITKIKSFLYSAFYILNLKLHWCQNSTNSAEMDTWWHKSMMLDDAAVISQGISTSNSLVSSSEWSEGKGWVQALSRPMPTSRATRPLLHLLQHMALLSGCQESMMNTKQDHSTWEILQQLRAEPQLHAQVEGPTVSDSLWKACLVWSPGIIVL